MKISDFGSPRVARHAKRTSCGSLRATQCGERKAGPTFEIEKLVRQRGLEPPRYCYRQPLKLVRLPVPPLPHKGNASYSSRELGSPQASWCEEQNPKMAA